MNKGLQAFRCFLPPTGGYIMNLSEKAKQLERIKYEVGELRASSLYEYRKKNKYYPVIGEGSHDAKIMFIGEAPGENEAKQGRPFCGAAGRVLDELMELAGIKRDSVYITNIVKDRPPENRDPLPEEIEFYAPFLDRQIDIIKPAVVVTLGRFSSEYIMEKYGLSDKFGPMGNIHGESFTGRGGIRIMPMYHPAASLYSGATKEKAREDMENLKQLVRGL